MKDQDSKPQTPVGEVFSDYVARLGPGGEPPDMESYRSVREALRAVLVSQMRRRGLWRSPPSFLGIPGASWLDGSLDELVSDAYVFIFIRRLRGMRNQQRLKGNIRPMVILNVKNFLTELQMKADPLGYRVFGRLRKAVEQAVERQEVLVLNGEEGAEKPRLNNGSLIGFRQEAAMTATRADLAEPAQRWNDELLPELITAEGQAVPAVVERLAREVPGLEATGVAAFYLRDLAAELKDDVRLRWGGVWQESLGELGTEPGADGEKPVSVRAVRPEEEPDWPRRQVLIEECVASSINQQRPPGNRRDLWSLWTLIRSTRLLPMDGGPLPSFAELGRRLRLTRDRVRQQFERLRPLVMACLRANLRSDDDGPPGEPTDDTAGERHGLRLARRGGEGR